MESVHSVRTSWNWPGDTGSKEVWLMISPVEEWYKIPEDKWNTLYHFCDLVQISLRLSPVQLRVHRGTGAAVTSPAKVTRGRVPNGKKIGGSGGHPSTSQRSPWCSSLRVVKQWKVTAYLNQGLILCSDKRLKAVDLRHKQPYVCQNTHCTTTLLLRLDLSAYKPDCIIKGLYEYQRDNLPSTSHNNRAKGFNTI